jgi:hypothetical protein
MKTVELIGIGKEETIVTVLIFTRSQSFRLNSAVGRLGLVHGTYSESMIIIVQSFDDRCNLDQRFSSWTRL